MDDLLKAQEKGRRKGRSWQEGGILTVSGGKRRPGGRGKRPDPGVSGRAGALVPWECGQNETLCPHTHDRTAAMDVWTERTLPTDPQRDKFSVSQEKTKDYL